MHSLHITGLGDLSEILASSYVLPAGERFVFTFNTNQLLNLASDSALREKLQYFLGPNYGDVISVNRPLFSGRYVVVVQPKANYSLESWLKAFDYSWQAMGMTSVSFLQAEPGVSSSSPGGVAGAARGTAEIASEIPKGFSIGGGTLLLGGAAIIGLLVLIPQLQVASFRRRY